MMTLKFNFSEWPEVIELKNIKTEFRPQVSVTSSYGKVHTRRRSILQEAEALCQDALFHELNSVVF